MEPLTGRTIGRYRILEARGQGGMGVVYRAEDTTLHREVGLKVLPAEAVADPERRQQLVKEAQLASRLEHPNIGVIHEIGEADGISFIVMELIRGESLGELMARGALEPARALELGTEIAEGLARAHDTGIVHRDLKPANVMITDDGHAKIIDFGLAKVLEAPSAGEPTAAATATGIIKGTAAYMSPEQARGKRLDARSDLFSFGVMLYEMLAGRPPFDARSYLDLLHAISHAPAPPLGWPRDTLAPEVEEDLQRLLDKCLAKAPEARYQTARDLIVDLRAVRRRLDGIGSGVGPAAVHIPASVKVPRRRVVLGASVLLLAAVTGVIWWMQRPPSSLPPLSDGGRPSVAVLYFQNNTGSADLEWLRSGLTDMLVTNLSQSPEMHVLSTDRLYQILAHLNREEEPVLSFDTIQEVARLAGVRHVLTGSYLKAGDTIRVNVRLQDAESGRIIVSDRLEAAGEANLFSTVDELTARLRARLAASLSPLLPKLLEPPGTPAPVDPSGYRDLRDVTTTSVEAYRAYVEAGDFTARNDSRRAEPLLERAIAIDPDFALAMVRMAIVQHNLRRPARRDEYARRALERKNRLTLGEQYYVEAIYYLNTEPRAALAAFHNLLAIDPQHRSGRFNLGHLYTQLERHAEAIQVLEQVRHDPIVSVAPLQNLALSYGSLGRFDDARAVLDEALRRFPESGAVYRALGNLWLRFGKLEEARRALDRAVAIEPDHPDLVAPQWTLAVLQEQWTEADRLVSEWLRSSEPLPRGFAASQRALRHLYRGQSGEAVRLFELATTANEGEPSGMPVPLVLSAGLHLTLGRPDQALRLTERIGRDTSFHFGGIESRYIAARALVELGRTPEAQTHLDWLLAQADVAPRARRRWHHVTGGLALERGELAEAVSQFSQSEALLPPSGHPLGVWDHPTVWFALGSAYLTAGKHEEATRRFERLVGSTERVFSPIEFVRSLYLLGEIAERRGDLPKAREYYRRFLAYWSEGDLDRERVAHAVRIAGHGG